MSKELKELERFIKTNAEIADILYNDYFKKLSKCNKKDIFVRQVTDNIKKIKILSTTLKDKINNINLNH